MKELIFFSLTLSIVRSLTCSIYDFSQSTVRCTQTCPASTTLIGSNCLAYNQYLINSQVFTCSGYVSADRSVCCSKRQFIQNNICLYCRGQVYNNGQSCCTDDNYLDFSQDTPNCVPLTTGNCPSLTLSSMFKVCCPIAKKYYLVTGQCVDPNGFNCDGSSQICCGSTQRLQYVEGQYSCVSQCSWTPFTSSGLFCQQQYCNQLNQTLRSVRSSRSSQSPLMSFAGGCCLGSDNTSQCLQTNDSCMSRFVNRGWGICCPPGSFYSAATQSCVGDCQAGTVVFGTVCITQSKMLDLTNSQPSEGNLYSTCNGVPISPNLPVCCPSGFFISDNTGCRLCNGNIFTLIGYQICCSRQQFFDSIAGTCSSCDGVIDVSGQLCCPFGSYISYDSSGNPSCANTCNLDNLYNSQSCCQSLTQSCSSTFVPNSCNPSYYNPQACKGCPSFCSSSPICSSSQQSTCNSTCGQNEVAYPGVGCLQCDQSCNGCNLPLDATKCITCAFGYTMVQSKCQICEGDCLTCYQFTDYCTSCQPNTKILINSKCVSACFNSGFFLDPLLLTCQACSNVCVQCFNNKANCSMCQDSTFLSQGTCSLCDYSCASCHLSAKTCTKCITGYLKNADGTCSQQCIGVSVTQYANGPICLPCHPSCTGCTTFPQNCYSCSSNVTFLDGSMGINVCTPCRSPCVTCTSLTSCISCVSGYYLSGSSCSKCDGSCLTCNGPSNSNCLSCFGNSNLTSNGYCSGCSKSCNICSGTTCTACSTGFILYQGICVTSCPNQTYYDGQSCASCDPTCLLCNASSCSKCASNYLYVLNTVCYSSCPSSYSPSGNTCIKNTVPVTPPKNTTNNDTKNSTNNPTNTTPSNPSNNPSNNSSTNPPNNTTSNNSTTNPSNNSTSNPSKNSSNSSSNNKTDNSSNPAVVSGPLISQAIVITGSKVFVNVYLPNTDVLDVNVTVNLVNSITGSTIALEPSGTVNKTNGKIYFSADLPSQDLTGYSLVETNAVGPNINSTQVTSQPSSQLVLSSYLDDTLSNMKVFGYVFSPIMLLFIVLTKIKGHYSAEEANNIILHSFNFGQVCYLFKYATNLESGGYFFLNGFGVSHLSFFPSFFSKLISPYYVQNTVEKTLIPDGNLLRNAGYTFSYQLVLLFLLAVAVLISVVYSKSKRLEDYSHMRKIMRLGILLVHIGFMNQLFFAFVQIIQPSSCQPDYQSFYNSNLGCAYMLVVLVPALMSAVLYHYYKTYNSDVLEHYYTLREGSLFLIIYAQAIIMCLSVGKPLVGLFLIPLEIVWFVFNYMLYKYGSGLTLSDFKKYFVVSGLISVSYLFLSLEGQVSWLWIVVVVSVASVGLIVYCGYQLVGIYYNRLFAQAKEGHES